jgi:hypothetical protein
MSEINRALVINYKNIFGSSNEDYAKDLSILDKTTWFRVLSRFNFLLRNDEKFTVFRVLSMWFREGNNGYANDLYQRIKTAYGQKVGEDPSVITLNLWTNLTLLDDILKQNGEDVKGDELDAERKLFNAYLSVNEIYGEKSDSITKELGKAEKGPRGLLEWLAKAILTSLLPYNDIVNPNVVELWMTQFVKACICFEYFEQDHPELLKSYFQKYGISDWRDYIKAIMPVIDHAVMHSKGGLSYLSIEHSENKEKSKMFLDSLSLNSDVIYEVKTDFIHARSNPLFKIDEETYLVIDQVLVINKMYNSIFFEMLQLLKDSKVSIKPYKDFFQLYTAEFIENHLSYKLLNRIHGNKLFYHLTGQEIKKKYNLDTEPDYYARNGNKVFLYEIKGSIITGDAKQSFSYAEIEKELKKKYYEDEDSDKKAVLQLIERIQLLFSDDKLYDPDRNRDALRIYPILLVSEAAMLTPGLNHLLNKWFRAKIDGNAVLSTKKQSIHDLVILDINSLILYNDQFRNNRNLLKEMIEGYEQQTQISRIEPLPASVTSESKLEALAMNMLVPFAFYLRGKIKVASPRLFLEYAEGIFPEGPNAVA